ncbi:MAG: hypothetical protein GY834_02350 [Bacteroidetes bacterium]|nr:hypothetical protein [Bacteroidota bacterium]
MPNNTASSIHSKPIYDPGPNPKILHNQQLASTYKIGDVVYESATGVWTYADKDTAASLLMRPGIICGPADRITATVVKDIDDAFTATEGVDICVGGGVILIAKITDPGGALQVGQGMEIGDDGALIKYTSGQPDFAYSISLWREVADDDTYALVLFM